MAVRKRIKRSIAQKKQPEKRRREQFEQVAEIIRDGVSAVHKIINSVVVNTYWKVGKYISGKVVNSEWGEGVVEELADYLVHTLLNPRGFSQRNLWRMKQFYETYCHDQKLSTLLTELPWSSHLHIMSKSKTPEEREFYLRLSIKEKYDVRAVERAIVSGMFERAMASPAKLSTMLRELHPLADSVFRDSYSLDFLGLPDNHSEYDLRKGIVRSLKNFIIVKKPHENHSIGIILCKGKDDEVVEYALNRTLSPAAIADYTTKLPDKRLLQDKLHEFFDSSVREMRAEYGENDN